MDLIKLEQFNILNQIHIKEESVTCGKCHNWLNGAIYMHTDCKSYCTLCSTDNEDPIKIQNKLQEDMLKDMRFPCKYYDCDFILRRDQIADHYTKCMYAPVQCGWCNDKMVKPFEIIKHFQSEHKDNTAAVTLTEPIFTVNFDETDAIKIYIITFKQRTLVILIRRIDCKLNVEIAESPDDENIHEENKFTVQCTSNGRNYLSSKLFISLSNLCHIENDNVEFDGFDVNAHESVGVEVRLCCFTNIIKMPECPICMHAFKMEMYQCANGHNVCIDCREKIKKCPFCQSTSMHIVKQKHFLSNTLVMCPNVEKGCLTAIKGDDFDVHDKMCSYKMVKCGICNVEYRKSQFILHFKEKHNLWNNCKQFVFKNESTEYIKFKSHVFSVCHTKAGECDNAFIRFDIILLFCDITEAEKYKFEVHILGKNVNDPIAKIILSGLCSSTSAVIHRLFVRYDTCAKYFVKNIEDEKSPILNYRCVITESDCEAV